MNSLAPIVPTTGAKGSEPGSGRCLGVSVTKLAVCFSNLWGQSDDRTNRAQTKAGTAIRPAATYCDKLRPQYDAGTNFRISHNLLDSRSGCSQRPDRGFT